MKQPSDPFRQNVIVVYTSTRNVSTPIHIPKPKKKDCSWNPRNSMEKLSSPDYHRSQLIDCDLRVNHFLHYQSQKDVILMLTLPSWWTPREASPVKTTKK